MTWWRLGTDREEETDGGVVTAKRGRPRGVDDDAGTLRDACVAVAGAKTREDVVDALTAGLADASGLSHAVVWL